MTKQIICKLCDKEIDGGLFDNVLILGCYFYYHKECGQTLVREKLYDKHRALIWEMNST